MTTLHLVLLSCLCVTIQGYLLQGVSEMISGTDPVFPSGWGANPPGVGGAMIRFCQIFWKNCMKLRKFSPVGGPAPPWIRHWICWLLRKLSIWRKWFTQGSEAWLLLHYQSNNDTLLEIELFTSIVLSSRVTNSKNDIHKFLQQFEWLKVNRDSNSHLKVLGVKQALEWQFTH